MIRSAVGWIGAVGCTLIAAAAFAAVPWVIVRWMPPAER